ncbi:hypothetical protein BaRGS_00012743 [Batillaria attramentaria]|uniref:Uncharacterized protein n=1 Tax=Batillaria attramentaria TaxID=370345 RepID=A0ABD0L9J0_9CAEN
MAGSDVYLVNINRLPPKHGSCDDSATSADVYAASLNTSYSKLSCLKSCYRLIAQRHCNCSMPIYYVEDRESVCDMADDEVDACTSSLHTTVPDEYDACDKSCPQPCSEVDYDMLVSAAAWPSENYKKYLEDKVSQSNYLLMGKDLEEEDFVKLYVYFKDLMYQKIDQQKAYESQNLISDIGGQLGLWLGLSAITIGELCGLLLSLFRSLTAVSPKDDNSSKTPVKPFSSPLEMDPGKGDVMMSDVKKGGFDV